MPPTTVAERLWRAAVSRRLVRAVPVVGLVVSVLYVAQRIRRKGLRRGSLDAALDVTPFVGRLKAVYEAFFGDIIPPPPSRVAPPTEDGAARA